MKKFWHSGHLNISNKDGSNNVNMARQRAGVEDDLVAGIVNVAYMPEMRSSMPLEAIREEEWEGSSGYEDPELQQAHHNRGFRVSPLMEFTTEHEIAELSPESRTVRKLSSESRSNEYAGVEATNGKSQEEEKPAMTNSLTSSRPKEESLATKENKLDKVTLSTQSHFMFTECRFAGFGRFCLYSNPPYRNVQIWLHILTYLNYLLFLTFH
jgi:hypothetical protein